MIRSFVIHLFCLAFSAQLAAVDFNRDGDFQFWLYGALNKKICENAKITFEPEVRFGDNGTTLYLYYFQSRLYINLNEWTDIAGGYRQLYVRSSINGKWTPIYSPLADIFLKRTVCNVRFDLRNRIQYLIFDHGPALWQYRQRYRLTTSVDICGITIEPTIHDEFFLRQRNNLIENRIAIGANIPANDKINLTLLYVFRQVKRLSTWRHQDVLWIWAYTTF